MKALPDAHTLLWFLAGSKQLSAVALKFIPDTQKAASAHTTRRG